jgi:hypothetical protein
MGGGEPELVHDASPLTVALQLGRLWEPGYSVMRAHMPGVGTGEEIPRFTDGVKL